MDKLDTLSRLLKLNKKPDSFHCAVCHQANQKRLSFPSDNHISAACFDQIHIDVWGPFSVQTHEGYKYFLTIVDDHSRATWIYMLKAKSDVLHIFPAFIKMIETQFGKTVKSVRTDNAPELAFGNLLRDKGILSFHSCPETPQQNSIVERKHQHILNVARALLFHSQVPLVYWGECVMSAVFLINRIPSPVLENKSPFQILINKLPDYNSLRSFGCLCYKSTFLNSRTKFDPRAKACVFLGYPTGIRDIGSLILKLIAFPFLGMSYSMKQYFLLRVPLFLTLQKLYFLVLHTSMTMYILYSHILVKRRALPLHPLMQVCLLQLHLAFERNLLICKTTCAILSILSTPYLIFSLIISFLLLTFLLSIPLFLPLLPLLKKRRSPNSGVRLWTTSSSL